MWAAADNSALSQAETASISPWGLEQHQSRWNAGNDIGSSGNIEEHMRSIIPPAFRNGNAKIVWQEPAKTLEDSLGTNNWPTPFNQLVAEQETGFSGSGPIQSSFASNSNSSPAWLQPEIDQQRGWDMPVASLQPQTLRSTAPFGAHSQNKLWPSDDQAWSGAQRPPAFHAGPPPGAFAAGRQQGWQQNALRGNVFPPPNRFAGPNIDNSPMNCWAQRPMSDTGMQPPMPPAAIPPPQRSRLQNVWSANVNTPVSGMYLPPPPTVDYNVQGAIAAQWTPPTGGSVAPPKPQFNRNYTSRVSPPAHGTYYAHTKTDSFMGDNAVWQDPDGEVRKWQRDTGTGAWGDPEKQSRLIRRWRVPAGEEFKTADGGVTKLVVASGWGELPTTKSLATSTCAATTTGAPINAWPNTTTHVATSVISSSSPGWESHAPQELPKTSTSQTIWEMITEPQRCLISNSWTQLLASPPAPDNSVLDGLSPNITQHIIEQLRAAVAKGFIDVSLLSKPLSNETVNLIHALLNRLPVLDQSEQELSKLMASMKINSGGDNSSVAPLSPAFMSAEQRADYDRLIIDIAASKTEIAALRERILATADNKSVTGVVEPQQVMQTAATTASSPRFGDSILDAAVRVEQQKLFSIY